MDKNIDIPEELYADDAICFIASRYDTSPQAVVGCVVGLNDIAVSEAQPVKLERNEVEIIKGLIAAYTK